VLLETKKTLKGMLWGAFLLLLMEIVVIYGVGLTVTLPTNQVTAIAGSISSMLQKNWPAMRTRALSSMHPFVRQESERLLARVTINVGGISIGIPEGLRSQVANDLNRILEENLESYMTHRFNPKTLVNAANIRLFLNEPMTFHVWVDLWRIPIPITLRIASQSSPKAPLRSK